MPANNGLTREGVVIWFHDLFSVMTSGGGARNIVTHLITECVFSGKLFYVNFRYKLRFI